MESDQLPQHIAIIMDGNRRWAKERGIPVLAGHKKVADEILEDLIESAGEKGIKYLTFWAWSTENWKRQQEEVSGIMSIFRMVISSKFDRLHKKGARVKIIGDLAGLDKDIQQSLSGVVEKTKNNTAITTIFAVNYGGRDEIIRAVNRWCDKQMAAGTYQHLTKENLSHFLDTDDIPDPDLIIRTGGEQRLSGFLLWQSEYSEFYFPQWYMPEFTPDKLDEALEVYASRKRNFGK
jgi:undecaprenyl diphosphate synthase